MIHSSTVSALAHWKPCSLPIYLMYHFDPTTPVHVHIREINPSALSQKLQSLITSLPVGVGLKGGLARIILREFVCFTTKNIPGLRHRSDFVCDSGNEDCDIIVAVRKVTPSLRLQLRSKLSGVRLGNFLVEAKDIEITDSMRYYFMTRDITHNECLIFRDTGGFWLYFTTEAFHDTSDGNIRPSIHCLSTVFRNIWKWSSDGTVFATQSGLSRCIIRFLKGHGLKYAIPLENWNEYKYNGETPFSLLDMWRVFKAFPTEVGYQRAVHHMKIIGLVDPMVRESDLWEQVISFMSSMLARFDKRFTMTEPNSQEIEAWISFKELQFQETILTRETLIALGHEVEPETCAEVTLPDGIINFKSYYA